jgi:hypothetical protein
MLANTTKVVPLVSYTPCHEDLLESGGTDPLILNLGIGLRCVVGSMLQRKYRQCPWVRRLGGPQNCSGKCGKTPILCSARKQMPVFQSSPWPVYYNDSFPFCLGVFILGCYFTHGSKLIHKSKVCKSYRYETIVHPGLDN